MASWNVLRIFSNNYDYQANVVSKCIPVLQINTRILQFVNERCIYFAQTLPTKSVMDKQSFAHVLLMLTTLFKKRDKCKEKILQLTPTPSYSDDENLFDKQRQIINKF